MMKNKIIFLILVTTLFLATSVSAQTNYSFSISEILSSMPAGKRLPDGTIVKAELITTGGATHSTGPSGSGTPGPDIGGLFTGITLPAYVGDKTPTNFTKIQMANTQNADNGLGNNCSSSIGFRIYFDRPITSINFLAVDIDGVHNTPNGNAEWVTFFGYNGNTYVPYIISGPTTSLTNQSINTSAVNHSWRTLINNSIGAAAAAALPNAMTIRRQTTNGGSGTPDDLNHQVLFTPTSSTTKVTDFFLMTGIWSVTGQANVQASGLSPIVITISSDFGDAPDSYKTLLASGGASHGVVGTLLLGNTDFAEPDGLPSVLANASIDDDGVQNIPPLTNNGQLISSYSIAASFQNNTGLPANYVAWIDWNNDGVFQVSEGTKAVTPAEALTGTVNLTWNNVTLTNTAGHAHTYLRVRTTTQAITISDTGGAFNDGEVEDYAIGLPAVSPDFACFNVGSSSGFINVLSNDTTGNAIVPSTVGFVNPGTATNLIIDGVGDIVEMTMPGEGVWKVNSSGQVSFEPQSNNVINPTPIAYKARDSEGNISNDALITLSAGSIPVDTTVLSQGCFPTTLTATASVPAGQSVVWYNAPNGGNVVASPTLSTTGSITYYAEGNNGTCTSAVRTAVTLTITAPPNPGNVTGTQIICQGTTTTFSSDGDSGGTWSSSDTSIATIDNNGIVTGVLPGIATITYTAIGAGGCSNLISTRTITIEDAAESGTLSGNQDICVGGTSTLTSSGASGGLWESEDISIATVDSNGLVTGISRGTTNIKYTIIQTGSCPVISSLSAVNIIEANPGTLSGNQNVCVGDTTTFTTDGDSNGLWTTDNSTIATVDANGVITGNATGTAIITYTITGLSGCPSASTTRTVTVNVNASATATDITGNDSEICPGGTSLLTVSSSTVTNPIFTWYADQTSTTALSSGATYSVSPSLTTTYYVSVKGNAVCENDPNNRKAIIVKVNTLGLATDIAAADSIICNGSSAALTASSTTVTTPVFVWYADQTSTVPLNTGPSYSPAPAITTTYYIGVSGDGVCENAINTRKAVMVTVNPLAIVADITADGITICNGSTAALTAESSNVMTPVFRWYADQTTTTVLSTGSVYNPVPTITTTYYVSVSGDGICENAINTRKEVVVTVDPLAQASDIIVADNTSCPGQAVSLVASSTTVTNPLFKWYEDQTTTTSLSTGTTFIPSPIVTTTYYVSVSGDGVCENAPNTRKAVTVSMNSLGVAADINSTDAVICLGDIATLTASSAIDGAVFIWYADQTSTNPLSVGEIFDPAPTVTTTYFVSVEGTNVCENAINTRKPVTVTVNPLGLASDITTTDAVICSGSSAALTASSTTVTTPVFIWYADQTTTTALSTGASYNVSPTVTTTYYVSVSGDAVCENAINTRKSVTVTVNPLGLASDIATADSTICSGSSAALTASSTTVTTPVFIWYADQTSTIALSTGASYNPSPTVTTTYYVSVSGDGVCENATNTRKPVTVTVNTIAVASDISVTTTNANVCTGGNTSITAASSIVNAVYNWYQDSALSVLLYTGATFTTPPLTQSASYYVTVKSDEVCENSTGNGLKVDINVILCSDIALTKTVSNSTPFVGDQVDFIITITNFGPDNATGVSANDVLPIGYTFVSANNGGVLSGNTITWPVSSVAVGMPILLKYSVKINASTGAVDEYKNVAQIISSDNFDPNSTPNNNDPSENDQDSEVVTPIIPQPSIQVYKDGSFLASNDTNGDGFPEVNETITYSFSVQNTGNIRLENVKINDQVIGVTNILVSPSTLEPGQIGRAQVNYIIKEIDIINGVVYNSAIAQGNTPPTGDNPNGTTVNDISTDPIAPYSPDSPYYDPACPDCTVVVLPNNPKIAIVKEVSSFSGDLNNAKVGDVISYLFTVSNIGNTPLSNVTVTDPLPGLSVPVLDPINLANGTGDLNSNGNLDLSEKWLYRSNYSITVSDLAKGQVMNQAVAKAIGPPTPVDPKGKDVSDLSDKSSPTVEDNNPTIIDIKGCQVIAHNAISPNGDNKNDLFTIDGIECYPQNTVEIYNRWGVLVFDTDGYDNEKNAFNGYSNGRVVIKQSAGLPTGTYYYIIKYLDSDSKEQSSAGYLFLSIN
ncbi:gliding motility-associated C-terminal domain-containing protein [Flavobacterium sp. 2]|uniref:Ig-like domain-containing protein n=1 Tax=Flavobacterium sp. 2 TaxID=308053 RepID=UPI000C1A01D1|nr:gliding motility-associated C-terminal domain-containing protein [Flavobacterium sp. 2]PIF70467.1 putative repeat protein (TIGR01451 family)/gliding motility-associated-like protein [Flavobacterium sp. 2]